jgi:TolA-binding protein
MENMYDKIQDYVDNTLPDTERQDFEAALATDKNLAQEVRLYQDLIKGIEIATEADLRQKIGSVQSRLAAEGFFNAADTAGQEAVVRPITPEKTAAVRRLPIYRLAIAASITLLIAVGFWLLRPSQNTPFEDTYTAYFQAETQRLPDIYTELSATGFAADKVRNESLKAALQTYQARNFTAAKNQLQNHLTTYPTDTDAQFYMAMSLMSLKENDAAVPYLEGLMTDADSRWAKDARWYTALIYLKIKEKRNAALDVLKGIARDDASQYQPKAKAIIEQLF